MQTSKHPKPRLYAQVCSCYGCRESRRTIKPATDPNWLYDTCINSTCKHQRYAKSDYQDLIESLAASLDEYFDDSTIPTLDPGP